MTFGDWVEESRERVRKDGWRGVDKSAYELYKGFLRRVGERREFGESVYDHPWDALVVLDGCRFDCMCEVAPEVPFVERVWRFESAGTRSDEWMRENFGKRDCSDTVHVTANPNSAEHLDAGNFGRLEEVWRDGWDDELGTVPARAVTDRAILAGRDIDWRADDSTKLVVHYMQPHFPSIPAPLPGDAMSRDEFGERVGVWERLRRGDLSTEQVWRSYRENLHYVLSEVRVLLDNLGAERVVITADHGNGFGEWYVYGHPDSTPISALRDVPWVVTSGTDTGSYEPERWMKTAETLRETDASDGADASVEERLSALGYR
ncbi:hypothetical protein BG842_06655 [Haladaptatus sp. W1]|uniref:hypothetical protein n=1 Tax=Haladaptatus sp. W1 TaxID=1897478 RepID=UPI0008499E60|nr:hypothetical protein [Haladaptatus sp. W1]ODR79575.1 hypothetical protein BG842_06655 [Haladaptatus sp. W1]